MIKSVESRKKETVSYKKTQVQSTTDKSCVGRKLNLLSKGVSK
jgi:hypothetical protein